MPGSSEYCSFTKAVEHLGDRWSLVIVRELTIRGPLGFNALIGSMPGISRSVLASRLRKLEDVGIVQHDRQPEPGAPGYRLTYAGHELRPILHGLWGWSERFVPQDPAMAERDPDILPRWLTDRVDSTRLPDHAVVIEISVRGSPAERFWLVLMPGLSPSACISDPCLDAGRYVYIESDVHALYPVARGERSMAAAIDDGSVQLFGDPALVEALPGWFKSEATVNASA
jgi:DNA-binding HxlR family transcriptional regulator